MRDLLGDELTWADFDDVERDFEAMLHEAGALVRTSAHHSTPQQ